MAADKIDMSLDDIIKMTHVGRDIRGRRGARGDLRRYRGGKRTRGSSAIVTAPTSTNGGYDQCQISERSFGGNSSDCTGRSGGLLRGGIQKRRLKPGLTQKAIESIRQHIEGEGSTNGRRTNPEGKLWIHNLDFGVKDADLQELFSVFGQLQKSSVHYNSSGRSLGSAEVTFSTQAEALQALKEYNNVTLDCRPMKIRLGNRPQFANAPGNDFLGSVPGDTCSGRGIDDRGRGREVGGRGREVGGGGIGGQGGRGIGGRRRGRGPALTGGRGREVGGRGIGGQGGRGIGGRRRGRGPALTKEQLDFEIDEYNHNN